MDAADCHCRLQILVDEFMQRNTGCFNVSILLTFKDRKDDIHESVHRYTIMKMAKKMRYID
jgi:hypothetical protein